MTHVFIGCDRIVGRRNQYFVHVSALEVRETFAGQVKDSALAIWRTKSPKGFAFTMLADSGVTHPAEPGAVPEHLSGFAAADLGLLQDTPAVRAAWEATLGRARALSPKVIVLETPLQFTPTAVHRSRIEWFAENLAPLADAALAWRPHGLWEPEAYVPWCRKLGIIPVFDPFVADEVPMGRGTGYFSVFERRGARATFTEFDMEELLDRLAPHQRVFVIFRGPNQYRNARLAFRTWESLRG